MQISLLLMEEIIKLFVIMFMGYAVVKAGLMKSSESKSISVVMVYLVIPCVIIDAFQVDYTADVKKGLLLACAAAVLVHVLFLILTTILKQVLQLDTIERATVIYSNAGILVIPLVQELLGQEYVIYSSAYIAVQLILIWTHCNQKKQQKNSISDPLSSGTSKSCLFTSWVFLFCGLEKKFATKSKIVNYIINRESTSKVEISKELNLSMPTVLSNVKDLLEKGIIIETGEYESTGGRKAKSIGINPSYRYAMGIVITANHLGMVLVNLKYEIVKSERIRLKFVSDMSYCSQVADYAAKFLNHMDDAEQKEKLLGVGISIPGIINQEQKLVIKSHALKLENYSLSFLEQAFSVSVYFANDANAAMMAEERDAANGSAK